MISKNVAFLKSVDSDEPVQHPFKLRNTHTIFKQLTKALIRLHVCAGWSEDLRVAHTILLEIPCHDSHYLYFLNVPLFIVKTKLTSMGKTQIIIPWSLTRHTS